MGHNGQLIINTIMALPEIDRLIIRPYSFQVFKAEAFDWEEIEPHVIHALKFASGKTEDEVVVEEFDQEDQGEESEEKEE